MVTKYFSVWVELIRNQIPEVLLLYSLKNNTTEFLSKIEKEEKTILIISHGLFLKLLINQLKKKNNDYD